ncbi:MAG TPA: pitrilysin family protein [Bacteroidota bacterium]|nr:pitrilysin family protein [Bacteroidota bacterium]
MKLLLTIVTVLLAGVIGSGRLSAAEKILPYPIHQHKLANGLNVVTVQFDSPGLAAFFIDVRVGSRNEVEPGVTGFAHFFEHMMFRGTDKYPRDKYNDVLKSIGAGANANTSLDRTIYHMTGDATKLETMFDLESDRFMNLHYTEHDFKTEAGAVKGEYTKNFASPYQQSYENTVNTAFTTHTYKHTTMGFFKDIVDMPNQYAYSLEFFNRYYRPEYSTIVVVGDVTPKHVNALAEKYFGAWKHGSYVSAVPSEPKQDSTRYTHLQNGSIPPMLGLNYKGPAFSDTQIDMPALDVLTTILFSPTSALYKKLVIEEQRVRQLGGNASDSRDPNLITIQASLVNKADLQYVKDEITKAVDRMKTAPVDAELLAKTKSLLKYSFAMRIDNPSTIANSLCAYITLTGDPESLNRLYALYDKVTAEDVKMAAVKYFVPSGLTVVTISADAEGGVK